MIFIRCLKHHHQPMENPRQAPGTQLTSSSGGESAPNSSSSGGVAISTASISRRAAQSRVAGEDVGGAASEMANVFNSDETVRPDDSIETMVGRCCRTSDGLTKNVIWPLSKVTNS